MCSTQAAFCMHELRKAICNQKSSLCFGIGASAMGANLGEVVLILPPSKQFPVCFIPPIPYLIGAQLHGALSPSKYQ